MIRRTTALLVGIFTLMLCSGLQGALAQDKDKEKQEKEEVRQIPVAYRLDYSVSELEDGKKINTRQYSMNLSVMNGRGSSGDTNSIKIGARVPVDTKDGEFQYLDIGSNIWNRVHLDGDTLTLEVRADFSNIAANDQPPAGQRLHPVVRQMQINGSTVVVPGKPMVIGVVDDPTSKKQFQLEVTVTKLR